MANDPASENSSPELVFGLVGPVGTDLALVRGHLADALESVNYKTELFRLSRFMREIRARPWSDLTDGYFDIELKAHISAGNALRKRLKRKDAMAMLGVGALREYRENATGETTKPMAGFAASCIL